MNIDPPADIVTKIEHFLPSFCKVYPKKEPVFDKNWPCYEM